jgi:EAL domain-containing protein (putative c-di-GMP-specific phosphodiesterase class I)
MKVVAEGIETKQDLACLVAEGCREGQGFYFSKAQPQKAILQLLSGETRRHVA